MPFDVGDKVVYPHHGAATIEKRERKEAFGKKQDYLVLRLAYGGFARVPPAFPVMAIFVLFMLAMAFRNVSYNTLTSKVPLPDERARFGSIQSSVQHLASAIGAFASAQFLTELPDHKLVGVDRTAYTSIALSVCLIPLFWVVEHRVTRPTRVAP